MTSVTLDDTRSSTKVIPVASDEWRSLRLELSSSRQKSHMQTSRQASAAECRGSANGGCEQGNRERLFATQRAQCLRRIVLENHWQAAMSSSLAHFPNGPESVWWMMMAVYSVSDDSDCSMRGGPRRKSWLVSAVVNLTLRPRVWMKRSADETGRFLVECTDRPAS